MKNSNYNQVKSLHKMWNTLDPIYIKDLIADNIYYKSYWVFWPIRGKERFHNYFEKKLQTIRDAVERNNITIESQIVCAEDDEDEYFLIIRHKMKDMEYESLINVVVEDGKITEMGIGPLKRRFKVNMINIEEK